MTAQLICLICPSACVSTNYNSLIIYNSNIFSNQCPHVQSQLQFFQAENNLPVGRTYRLEKPGGSPCSTVSPSFAMSVRHLGFGRPARRCHVSVPCKCPNSSLGFASSPPRAWSEHAASTTNSRTRVVVVWEASALNILVIL